MRREEQFTVGELARLDVDVPTGDIQLVPGDAGRVHVALDAKDPQQYEITQLGDTVSVRAPSGWLSRGGKVQLVVVVPNGTDAAVSTASGDISSRVELGVVRLRSSSGDVHLERARRAELHSASGDLTVGDVVEAQLTTASGDIRVRSVAQRIGASSASGDVTVERLAGGTDVATTSGDIRLRRCEADDITIKTVSGDVFIGLPGGIRVEPEISTLSGSTRLPSGAAPVDTGPRRTVRLRIRTVSGDIRIDRVDAG